MAERLEGIDVPNDKDGRLRAGAVDTALRPLVDHMRRLGPVVEEIAYDPESGLRTTYRLRYEELMSLEALTYEIFTGLGRNEGHVSRTTVTVDPGAKGRRDTLEVLHEETMNDPTPKTLVKVGLRVNPQGPEPLKPWGGGSALGVPGAQSILERVVGPLDKMAEFLDKVDPSYRTSMQIAPDLPPANAFQSAGLPARSTPQPPEGAFQEFKKPDWPN